MNDYITTDEVASFLRIKSRKVYDLVSKDEIPYKKVMGKLLFSKKELDDWLNANKKVEKAFKLPSVMLGSHDPLLEESLKRSNCGIAISFDGSKQGLIRMNNFEGIAAGLHIFEEEEEWNINSVKKQLMNKDVVLMEWAKRSKGLVFKKNKTDITSIIDLKNLNFANRQKGTGTEIYLDYLFKKNNLTKNDLKFIKTYYTETDAVMSVYEGETDATFGLKSEAMKFDLNFVELVKERFDIVLDKSAYFEENFQILMKYCNSGEFNSLMKKFPGYDLSEFGKFHYVS
tara:strand:- start:2835 stop:3692 length:858 start_codon:yes stop_codon:yes gene_type:complete